MYSGFTILDKAAIFSPAHPANQTHLPGGRRIDSTEKGLETHLLREFPALGLSMTDTADQEDVTAFLAARPYAFARLARVLTSIASRLRRDAAWRRAIGGDA